MSILYINPNNLVKEESEFVAKENELKKIITIKKDENKERRKLLYI